MRDTVLRYQIVFELTQRLLEHPIDRLFRFLLLELTNLLMDKVLHELKLFGIADDLIGRVGVLFRSAELGVWRAQTRWDFFTHLVLHPLVGAFGTLDALNAAILNTLGVYENLAVETSVTLGDERVVLIAAGTSFTFGVTCNFSEAMTSDVNVCA